MYHYRIYRVDTGKKRGKRPIYEWIIINTKNYLEWTMPSLLKAMRYTEKFYFGDRKEAARKSKQLTLF